MINELALIEVGHKALKKRKVRNDIGTLVNQL